MKLARISIKNFRSIESIELRVDDITRLIGANGSGKSTILKALEIFYMSGTPPISIDDFHNRNKNTPDRDAEIKLTFTDLSADDLTRFGGRVSANGTLAVTRVVSLNPKTNGKYYGNALKNPNFSGVRLIDNANEKKAAYKILQESYPDLGTINNKAGEIEKVLCVWEETNPHKCEESRDDGQFFGFQNVGQGKLSESTAIVYIPAVRDASLEAVDGKGSAASKLLELVVKSAVESRPDIRNFRQEVEKKFREIMDPTKLTELDDLGIQLSTTLQTLYSNTNVLLNWKDPPPLILPFPAAEMKLDDEGFLSPVDRTGHGLQRALFITLLQHLALAAKKQSPSPDEDGENKANESHGLPGLILAIEEPELYQHPTKQRHVAAVLQKLAAGEVPGVAASTQVIYTTHAPLFISMDKFREIRLVRRQPPTDKTKQRSCVVNTADLDKIAKILESGWAYPEGTFTADTLIPRLHTIDGGVSEGFFSCVGVLVEGPSDRAALQAAAIHLGHNLEAQEIAILSVGGKSSLDKPLVIFREMGIPTFVMWDNDKSKPKDKSLNHVLQRLVGIPEDQLQDALTKVEKDYVCFEENLETILKSEIGVDRWERLLDELKVKYGVTNRDDAQKIPSLMAELLKMAAGEGSRSQTLEKIISNIIALRPITPVVSASIEAMEENSETEVLEEKKGFAGRGLEDFMKEVMRGAANDVAPPSAHNQSAPPIESAEANLSPIDNLAKSKPEETP